MLGISQEEGWGRAWGVVNKDVDAKQHHFGRQNNPTFHQGSINSVQCPLQMVDDDEDTIATLKVPQKRKRAWEEAAEAQDPEALEAARKEKEMEEDQREKEEFEQRMRVSQRPVSVLVDWCGAPGKGSVSGHGCW